MRNDVLYKYYYIGPGQFRAVWAVVMHFLLFGVVFKVVLTQIFAPSEAQNDIFSSKKTTTHYIVWDFLPIVLFWRYKLSFEVWAIKRDERPRGEEMRTFLFFLVLIPVPSLLYLQQAFIYKLYIYIYTVLYSIMYINIIEKLLIFYLFIFIYLLYYRQFRE